MESTWLDGASLTLEAVCNVADGRLIAKLHPDARARMERSASWVRSVADGKLLDSAGSPMVVYGVNTGYGSLARVRIDGDQMKELSFNLVRSHAAGVGPPLPARAVRAMMLLRANALAKGASGCRPELVETLCTMLERDVIPEVPSRGSCGSSGDLAPLAHLGLVVFGGPGSEQGTAFYRGKRMPAPDAMAAAAIPQLVPGPKEGLAMTNGAQLTTAIAALVCFRATALVKLAEVAAALSFEALRGTTRALHPAVHALRPHPGAIASAEALRRLLAGSGLVDSIPEKVQDAYSLRCTPAVLGAVRDALTYAHRQVSTEINAATDNPLVLVEEDGDNKAFSAGLFHGEPMGFVADHMKLALCELASISERRTYRLVTGDLSARLPPLLAEGTGLGAMMPQVAAAASVSAARQLAFPNTADSIPTCEDQEDHVAMSTSAARRAQEVLEHAEHVVAIEIVCAVRGILHRQRGLAQPLGAGTAPAFAIVAPLLGGPTPSDDISSVLAEMISGRLLTAVESAVSALPEVARG